MNILVCLSQVPDTTTKIAFTENDTKLNNAGVQFIINPYDELALTKALELNEAAGGGKVTVIHVGGADAEPNIRKALAVGADEAVRIDASPEDAQFVASQIAAYAKDKGFDLIMTGRESIDFNSGLVAGLLSEYLGWPLINVVTSISVSGSIVNAQRDIDGGRETVQASLPCVVSAQKELTEPRIPNMRGIMAARTKPLSVVSPSGSSAQSATLKFELPPAKGAVKLIDPANAGQLIQLLNTEAKVI